MESCEDDNDELKGERRNAMFAAGGAKAQAA